MFLLNREEIWCAVGTDGWLVARHSEPPTCDPMERRCGLRALSVGQGKGMGASPTHSGVTWSKTAVVVVVHGRESGGDGTSHHDSGCVGQRPHEAVQEPDR
jgi:hypothetical protein